MKKQRRLLVILLLFTIFYSCNTEHYEGDILQKPVHLTCVEAAKNTDATALAFNSATIDDYTQMCADYKAALEAQIGLCGDAMEVCN